MPKAKRKRTPGKEALLLPHVSEEEALSEQKPLSEEAIHAEQTVELLMRDLFGQKGTEVPPEPKTEPQPIPDAPEEEGEILEVPPEPELPEELPDGLTEEAGEDAFEEEEEPLTLKEQIESSTQDFRLLLEMDYEDELGDAIGFEKIRAYHERELNGKTSAARKERNPRIREFEHADADTEVRRVYTKRKTACILHFVLSAVLLVLLLIYERASLMASAFGGPLDGKTYPIPYILIGIQLLLIDVALSHRALWEGLLRLVRFSPVSASLGCSLVIVTLLYHLVLLFLPHTTYPVLYLSPAALCLLLWSATELLDWYRESVAFDVVSARRQKYAMLPRVCVGGKEGSAKERLLLEDEEKIVWYLRPVDFVRNYFNNTARRTEHYRNLGPQLLLILGLAAAIGLFALGMGKSAERVAVTVFVTVLLCAPTISLFLTSVPMFFAALLRLRGKGAIIGETPISQSGGPVTLVLPDNEIFPAMQHEHLRFSSEGDAHRVSVLMRALLERIHSPLAEAFSVDVGSRLDPAQLSVIEVAEQGVAAEIGERGTRVLIGTPEYLAGYGLEVASRAKEVTPELYARMLAVAVDDHVAAQLWVHYTVADDVKRLLRDLDHCGVHICVQSKDPCVREDVFARLFPRLGRRISVSKPSVRELELRTSRVDSTVVALGSCKEVARTYVACCRVRRVGFFGRLLQSAAMLIGAVLSFGLALIGGKLSAATLTLWILFWSAGYSLLSYFALRRPSDDI